MGYCIDVRTLAGDPVETELGNGFVLLCALKQWTGRCSSPGRPIIYRYDNYDNYNHPIVSAETLRELALAKFHAVFSSLSPSSTLEQFADRFFYAEELDVAREAISLASTLDRLGIAEVVVEA